LQSREPRVVGWIRSALIGVALVYAVLAAWGMYRRIWQVQRIELSVPSTTLSDGSTVSYDVITSGEVQNLIRLELVQRTRSVVLAERRGRLSAINTIDPRLFRDNGTVRVSAGALAGFVAGPAVARLTVFGGQKLLHTPAPRVREVAVNLAR
jgi:hypothetical protein